MCRHSRLTFGIVCEKYLISSTFPFFFFFLLFKRRKSFHCTAAARKVGKRECERERGRVEKSHNVTNTLVMLRNTSVKARSLSEPKIIFIFVWDFPPNNWVTIRLYVECGEAGEDHLSKLETAQKSKWICAKCSTSADEIRGGLHNPTTNCVPTTLW